MVYTKNTLKRFTLIADKEKEMKVTVKEKSSEIEYPCLMVTKKGEIVLFYAYKEGTCIAHLDTGELPDWQLGEYSDTCIMRWFKPFTGSVTLSNEE